MICNVKRSQLDGVIKCPPSKSYTHRAIFLASLAEGKSTIYNPLLSNDTRASISACEKFGARIDDISCGTVNSVAPDARYFWPIHEYPESVVSPTLWRQRAFHGLSAVWYILWRQT